nr:2'-5' RNA ligase family protein [Halobellus ruber]
MGFEGDDHAFTPHVTLARMDDARRKELVQRVVRETDPDLGSFRVETVRLTQSTLTDDGPVYETLRAVEL